MSEKRPKLQLIQKWLLVLMQFYLINTMSRGLQENKDGGDCYRQNRAVKFALFKHSQYMKIINNACVDTPFTFCTEMPHRSEVVYGQS
ncbi:MAG: hypothetical protein KDF59_00555 [Nitrosomonas sp.]|nr:hypothetical protein [Nitrosomonas sp.]